MNTQNEETKEKYSVKQLICISIVACFGLWVVGLIISNWMSGWSCFKMDNDNNAPALFGDSFGAVNALISAFAFAGVIVSMYLQRKDLELQRKSLEVQQEELKQNTQELKLQRGEFEVQNKTMKLQRFENTFFNMLSLQQEIVNSLRDAYYGETLIGRSVFNHLSTSLLMKINSSTRFLKIDGVLNPIDHYFSHLYRIVKFVDESYLLENKEERYSYIAILRSTLSRYELVFLFYNELNFPKFKKLIEEYSLFNNLHEDSLFDSKDTTKKVQMALYAPSAYDPDIKGYNKVLQ